MKYCSCCKQNKDFSEFYSRKSKYDYRCRECERSYRRKYYIEKAEYIKCRTKYMKEFAPEQLERRNQKALLWREKNSEKVSGYRLKKRLLRNNWNIEHYKEQMARSGMVCANSGCNAVGTDMDHDHVTGKPRGFLCGICNRSLGVLKEDPNKILGLLDYLIKWHPEKLDVITN